MHYDQHAFDDSRGSSDTGSSAVATAPLNRTAPSLDAAAAALPTGETADLTAFLHQLYESDSHDIYAQCLQFMERYVLTDLLKRTAGNQSEAARLLGITRGSLRYKIRASGLAIHRIVEDHDGPEEA